ncbi:MAG: hypothetical protein ACON49_06995 [Candidatus Puniceispirillaceae bacterium]
MEIKQKVGGFFCISMVISQRGDMVVLHKGDVVASVIIAEIGRTLLESRPPMGSKVGKAHMAWVMMMGKGLLHD